MAEPAILSDPNTAGRHTTTERPPRQRLRLTRMALIVPVAVFFLVFFVYPVLIMMLKSVTDVPAGAGALTNFAWFFGDATNMRIFAKTLGTSAWVTACCVLVAYP